MANITTYFCENFSIVEDSQNTTAKPNNHPIVSVDRLTAALSQPSILIPSNLSQEEKRAFILSHAK